MTDSNFGIENERKTTSDTNLRNKVKRITRKMLHLPVANFTLSSVFRRIC